MSLKKTVLFLSAIVSLMAGSASANSSISNATVISVFTADQGNGAGFVYFNSSIPGVLGCGAGNANRYAINLNTPAGRAMYASAMMAFTTGKPVDAVGSGNCSTWGDTEGGMYMNVHN